MDEGKIKTFALLMAYDLPSFIKNTLKDFKDNVDEDLFEKMKSDLSTDFHIDIYSWDPSEKDISFLLFFLRFLTKINIIEVQSCHNYFNALGFRSQVYNLNILAQRFSYIVNKYYYKASFFFSIFKNYCELKKHLSDLEIGSEKFDDVIIKHINRGGKHLKSKRTFEESNQFFLDLKQNRTPKHNFILKNLPFDILDDINTTNENKIKLIFKRQLAIELFPYIDSTSASKTFKERTYGLAFSIACLSLNEQELIQRKVIKDPYYEFDIKDLHSFWRIEGKNVINSL